jgi:uncharacterized phage protein gp47/JayE
MTSLIPAPNLDDREGARIAADMIGRVSGGLTIERIDAQIAQRRELRALIESGDLPEQPICPTLTNANPSSEHTVILETFAWQVEQMMYRINKLPVRDQIAFATLFGITLREAAPATTTLTFTSDGQHEATVPAGTVVGAGSGQQGADEIQFVTNAELVIAEGDLTGSVAATCTVAGARWLTDGTLTNLVDAIAFITAVTNEDPVDSGTEAETVDQALARARNFQRRAMRLVSEKDVEDYVLEEVLQGVGIVKAFQFIKQGDFEVRHAGHTSIVVMTANANPISAEIKAAITAGLTEAIGSQFFYLLDPIFVEFDVTATIKVESIAPQDSIKAAVERNLRAFYVARKGNFGRTILRSEIIAIIEGTPGVDRIVSDPDGPIVQTPGADLAVAPYELPKLNLVTLTVAP